MHCFSENGSLVHSARQENAKMYQVTFSDQSMSELNQLEIDMQMPLVEKLSNLTREDFDRNQEDLAKFSRDGKTFYRLRAGEYRIYFELNGETLFSHFILHQHSLADFVFRFKLPYTEDTLIEQHQSFWKYLESLKK